MQQQLILQADHVAAAAAEADGGLCASCCCSVRLSAMINSNGSYKPPMISSCMT